MNKVALIDNFVSNLIAFMERKHVSQAELARRSGVHHVTVNKIINHKMSPTVELCERLAVALDIPPERFFKKPS